MRQLSAHAHIVSMTHTVPAPGLPLLVSGLPGGDFYVGPLAEAKQLIATESGIVEYLDSRGVYRVEFRTDLSDVGSDNEFGAGPDQETAWRYALGAAFGPMDEFYDELLLADLLASVSGQVAA